MITQKTLSILLFSIVFALTAAGGLWWMVSEVGRLGSEMEVQVQVIADSVAQEQQYEELNDLIESSEQMRVSLEQLALTEERTIDFLAEIEAIGREQGVTLETSSLQVKETEQIFDNLEMNFSVTGSQVRVENMMRIFESLPYHSELQTVRITNDQESNETTMTVILTVSILSA